MLVAFPAPGRFPIRGATLKALDDGAEDDVGAFEGSPTGWGGGTLAGNPTGKSGGAFAGGLTGGGGGTRPSLGGGGGGGTLDGGLTGGGGGTWPSLGGGGGVGGRSKDSGRLYLDAELSTFWRFVSSTSFLSL